MSRLDPQCSQLAHHAKTFLRRQAPIIFPPGPVGVFEIRKLADVDGPHGSIIVRVAPNPAPTVISSKLGSARVSAMKCLRDGAYGTIIKRNASNPGWKSGP